MPKYTIYQGLAGQDFILRENEDGSLSSFATDLANPDYQAYLKSLDEAATL
jgi:hypothetical protein